MDNAKIIVVDDDPGIRDSLQMILASHQYTVITAADRNEGMSKIRTEKPDLLILDIMMASWLDGLDMSKTLKDDLQFKDMPILMLTGVKEKTIFDFRPRAGGPDWCSVDAYLDKPVEPELLLAEIERLLSKKKPDTN
jgi:DNA-binding response OmpR family regulator